MLNYKVSYRPVPGNSQAYRGPSQAEAALWMQQLGVLRPDDIRLNRLTEKLGRLREMGDKKMEELSDTSEDEQDQQYPSNNNLTPSDWDDSDLDQDDQEENRQDFH